MTLDFDRFAEWLDFVKSLAASHDDGRKAQMAKWLADDFSKPIMPWKQNP